jgi:putative membrane protein insertion efficiency factor
MASNAQASRRVRLKAFSAANAPMSRLILAILAFYKRFLSPLFGARCRFDPSCANYARVAVARFGTMRGGALALWRIARCQPLARGGSDPVPAIFTFARRGARDEHL